MLLHLTLTIHHRLHCGARACTKEAWSSMVSLSSGMNLNDDASQVISPEMKIWAARPSELPVLWDRSLTEIPLNSPLLEKYRTGRHRPRL
ncbi:hypothetical protein C8R48DRAFT_35269 [Suillus tomentosus]|nr:hypothetical protein C8R48DRAFT_35269 [Suillus tomentosus]